MVVVKWYCVMPIHELFFRRFVLLQAWKIASLALSCLGVLLLFIFVFVLHRLLWRRGIDGHWKRDDFQIDYLNTNGSAGSFQYMKRHQRFEDKTSYYTVVLCLILITTTGTAHCLFSILLCNSGTKEFLRKNMNLFVLPFSLFLLLLIFIFKFVFDTIIL